MNHHLFTVSNDAKTVKGEAHGWLTAVLYLAPADLSGTNVCPRSTPECRALCLNTAGRGAFNMVQEARLRRTHEYLQDSGGFARRLAEEVEHWRMRGLRKGMRLAVRVNGTSDLPALARRVADRSLSEVRFYDYTKILGAIPLGNKGPIHYTFSRSERNDADCIAALDHGANVAVVFSTKRGEALPKEYRLGASCFKVIDGDEHDLRFLDKRHAVIVGLRAKGRARKHVGGFVVQV